MAQYFFHNAGGIILIHLILDKVNIYIAQKVKMEDFSLFLAKRFLDMGNGFINFWLSSRGWVHAVGGACRLLPFRARAHTHLRRLFCTWSSPPALQPHRKRASSPLENGRRCFPLHGQSSARTINSAINTPFSICARDYGINAQKLNIWARESILSVLGGKCKLSGGTCLQS